MRTYVAAGTAAPHSIKDVMLGHYPHVLVAYDASMWLAEREAWPYVPDNLFLDSGAFTAWSTGKTVDIDRYADWVKQVMAWHPSVLVASLDVIPGSLAERPTYRQTLTAVEQGFENADYLRSLGIEVIETYHRFEPLQVLERICDRRRPGGRIAFGGLVGGRDVQRKIRFCDTAFKYLNERYGKDGLPAVHGFGIGPDSRLGTRYYWHSVDCTTWLGPRKFGEVIGADGRPRGNRGTADWRPGMRAIMLRWLEYEKVTEALWAKAGIKHDVQ